MKPLDTRRAEALARKARWASLSREQQIAELNFRLGVDTGAVAQRARIVSRAPTSAVALGTTVIAAAADPAAPKPERVKHKKGKRGDGRRAK